MGLKDVRLLGISASGDLAVVLRPQARARMGGRGTLARVPVAGGLPRELAEDSVLADWSPSGELTAVRVVGASYRIERPLGTSVFETSGGWISDLRISPEGDNIAFVDHQSLDSSGVVKVLDAHNTLRVLTRHYAKIEGLAWNPKGSEVWFTAGDGSWRDTLWAAPLHGSARQLYRSPGSMRLEDIALDGKLLFTLDDSHIETSLLLKGESTQHRVSGISPITVAISRDGRLLAYTDEFPSTQYGLVVIRGIDGSPPKVLGEGLALDISADTKTVLARSRNGLVLLPTGPGAPQKLLTPGLEIEDARLLGDGKRMVVAARPIHEQERRLFMLEAGQNAAPRSISAVGISRFPCLAVSPDERWVAAWDSEDRAVVLSMHGGESVRFPEIPADRHALPVGWSSTGDLWLLEGRDPPAHLVRVDLVTHQVKESRELSPNDPTGVSLIFPANITSDGSIVSYSYIRVRSRLFVMRGADAMK